MTEIVIKPKSARSLFNASELWRYRELFYIFAWRDIKVRYKQTAIGIAWVLFQPLVTMIIFTMLFSGLVGKATQGLPYPIFVLTGLIMWNYFSGILTHATNSFVENETIIKKVYFPKEILPLSSALTAFIDFAISSVLFIVLLFYFHIMPSLLILVILPLAVLISTFSAIGIGFFLASFNVKYRDIRYILPFFMQLFFFLTPIVYSENVVPSQFRSFLFLNPITGILTILRQSIANAPEINYSPLVISFFVAAILFFLGLLYFRKVERYFSDII
jgi:lipopolysaccharide transport system permease protein